MTREFVAVALRVFALWMGVCAVQSILSIFILTEDFSAAAYVLYAVTYAVAAAFLWMFPLKIAGHVLASDSGACTDERHASGHWARRITAAD